MSGTAHMRHGLYILIAGRGGAGADRRILPNCIPVSTKSPVQCSKNICV